VGSSASVNNVTYTVDDEAPALLPNNGAWSNGSYRPAAYYSNDTFPAPGPGASYALPGPLYGTATFMSVFDGAEAAGDWKLYTRDEVTGDGGSIAGGWSLDVKLSTTAPETSLKSGPPAISNTSSASFAFEADRPGTLQCSLDGGDFAPFTACTSPIDYSGLADGPHTFALRATDAAGNVDETGPTRAFTVQPATTTPTDPVDKNDPVVALTKRKLRSKHGKQRAIIARFSGNDDLTPSSELTFTCKLDDGAPAACTSPTTFSKLSFGRHTLSVVATDQAGKTSKPAVKTFQFRKRKPRP
jgi:hypothetical protein